jgi:hypothetical protein
MLDLAKQKAKTFDLKFEDGSQVNILMPNNELLIALYDTSGKETDTFNDDIKKGETLCLRIVNHNNNCVKFTAKKLKDLGVEAMQQRMIIDAYSEEVRKVMANPNL